MYDIIVYVSGSYLKYIIKESDVIKNKFERLNEKTIVKCIKNLELDKVYKNRKEVISYMGLPESKNKGNSGKIIDEYLEKYTEQVNMDGRKYLFKRINIPDDKVFLDINTLKGIMNLGILKLLTENYKRVKINDGDYVVLIPKNELLFDLKTFNNLFKKYQYSPTKFLADNVDVELNNVNATYEFMSMVRNKLTKNLKDSLNDLKNQGAIEYIFETPFIDYNIDRRVLKQGHKNTSKETLKILSKEQLDDITDRIETTSYKDILVNGSLKGVDIKNKLKSIESYYQTAERRVLDKYSEIFNIGFDSYDNINWYRFAIKSKIEGSKDYRLSSFYKEINKVLKDMLFNVIEDNEILFYNIHVIDINYKTQITYNIDLIANMLRNEDSVLNFNMKDINDLIVYQIKKRAEERHIDIRDKFKDYDNSKLDDLMSKFTDKVRFNDNYVKDYNKLTNKLIKID